MKNKHYGGRIVEGEFEDRVYLKGMEYSLPKMIMQDFKNTNVIMEVWVTSEFMDFNTLYDVDTVDFFAMPTLQQYSQYRVNINKESLMALFYHLTTEYDYFLNVVITEYED